MTAIMKSAAAINPIDSTAKSQPRDVWVRVLCC